MQRIWIRTCERTVLPRLTTGSNQLQQSEIQARIISGNRCYYSCGALMKSRALNRSLKLKIYKTSIRPVVTYGCEAWTLTSWYGQLRIFEQKILRRIFGPVQDENGFWPKQFLAAVTWKQGRMSQFRVQKVLLVISFHLCELIPDHRHPCSLKRMVLLEPFIQVPKTDSLTKNCSSSSFSISVVVAQNLMMIHCFLYWTIMHFALNLHLLQR